MKMIIYQVLPRLFGNRNPKPVFNGSIEENGCGKFSAFTVAVLKKIKEMGFTHVWYTGLIEHATQTDYSTYGLPQDTTGRVKGKAGSPYAIRDYYGVDPDLADEVPNRMAEFEALVQRTHDAGLKVIMDFVPNHVSVCNWNFEAQNYYYYPDGEQRVSDYDWYDTVKLNYDNRDTWYKMGDILLFWARKGVDGFRCDMAEMVPVAFWAWAIPRIKKGYPEIRFIAEIYNPNQYRNYIHTGKFDYLYDKVGLYDTVRQVITGHASAECISACWQSVDDILSNMLNFLENHDEQRIASDFFASDALKGRPALAVCALMNTNPFLVYFGQELGERGMNQEGFSGCDGRTTIFDYWNSPVLKDVLSEKQLELRQYYTNILQLCNQSKAVRSGAFFDLMYANLRSGILDCNRQYAFMRYQDDELLLIVANFAETEVNIQVQIPYHLFECFQLSGKVIESAQNVLTGQACSPALKGDELYPVHVPALDAAIIRFSFRFQLPVQLTGGH